ncbi:RT0821/Lpp0805 family surface protein [Microvirga sp. KLBC 81]|uniref:RT0821/Lpp0805 family surface protein n=1 Tax=Microvirga sp. KLBC 81 TaxID=1862707 RepID=UPI001FE131E5|nr:RT0821/Lpp0805 family surface protein [Microvirga sp. KLBC 81]
MRADARRYKSDAFLSEAMKMLAVGMIALSAGACSFSFGTVGLQEEEPQVTDSVSRTAVRLSPGLNEEDWRRAKAALSVALDPQRPGTQVSWDNPASDRKGTFTPTSAPFVKDDQICRNFTALINGSSSSSVQGMACRPSGGGWVIKGIKPVKTTAKV